jgi:hypothetical protein
MFAIACFTSRSFKIDSSLTISFVSYQDVIVSVNDLNHESALVAILSIIQPIIKLSFTTLTNKLKGISGSIIPGTTFSSFCCD